MFLFFIGMCAVDLKINLFRDRGSRPFLYAGMDIYIISITCTMYGMFNPLEIMVDNMS